MPRGGGVFREKLNEIHWVGRKREITCMSTLAMGTSRKAHPRELQMDFLHLWRSLSPDLQLAATSTSLARSGEPELTHLSVTVA